MSLIKSDSLENEEEMIRINFLHFYQVFRAVLAFLPSLYLQSLVILVRTQCSSAILSI